jgi:F-type H+/Na+-transporting ATPase subunit alpha
MLERGKRIVEVFKQPQYNPMPVEVQAAVLWTVQNNFFDDVPWTKIKDFQAKLTDFSHTRKPDCWPKSARKKPSATRIAAELKAAVTEFKQTYH